MLRVKNGKGIDVSDNLHYQVPRNILQHYSDEDKHKAEDIVDPTQLNISEARPNNKSSPLRSTNGTLADFNSNFENEPDPEIEKMNPDCCENNKQEHKNKEENELGKEEQGEGHGAEDGRQSTHRHPEESAGADRGHAAVTAATNQCAGEAAPADPATDEPVQRRNDGSQVGALGSPSPLC